jgi:phosphoribosylanthranilate isomerase
MLNGKPKNDPKIKICGLKHKAEIEECITYNARYIGFVFYEKSSRYISFNNLKSLALDKYQINKVGVFVRPKQDDIKQALDLGCNVIQIHDASNNQDADKLIQDTLNYNQKTEFIISFSVSSDKSIIFASQFIDELQKSFNNLGNIKVLFDTQTPQYGGSGTLFDWGILSACKDIEYGKFCGRDFFMSGGINASNVSMALNYSPFVDVSSGVESTKGVKDLKKIKEFLQIAWSQKN